MSSDHPNAEQIVLEVMHHFGFRRNYQVAEYFNVTPQTLSGWIKTGEIPPKHLIKYTVEVLGAQRDQQGELGTTNDVVKDGNDTTQKFESSGKFSWIQTKQLLKENIWILFGFPITTTILMIVYVFWIASPVYTSISKVLPISEDGSSSNGFSGVAAQLGINIPLTIGGTVPWDEIYPEIVKSSDLLNGVLKEDYITEKYGKKTLENILIEEFDLSSYPQHEQKNRAMDELNKMINITKDRLSPVVTLEVAAFEPLFASKLSKQLIEKSGQIQRQLKTNRVRQKRLFIEERLQEVSFEMNKMEKKLREFREYNRNISSSPSLQMRVQEMGREIDLQNSLYVTLKTQHEKAKIDEVERDDMVQIIDGPNIPTDLTKPRRGLSIVLSLFFGVFAAIFTIYFRKNYIETHPV
jgi:capsule polysaccharide export protein KpsE/RkpR